jgi:hypothetical protein
MEEMKKLTINGQTAEVSVEVYHFYEMMENHGTEFKDFNELINDFTGFLRLWNNFKARNESEEKKSEFEKKLNTHILVHTIKPRTQYAHQQEKKNGKNILYPVYYFDNVRVHSMAPGGNYPINECNFYVQTRKGDYVKIK